MSIGSIMLGVALLFVVALYVGRPFMGGQLRRRESLDEQQALLARKEVLLNRIRVLDFENETGKMPDEEYTQQRNLLLHEAAAVFKALDNLTPAGGDRRPQVAVAGNGQAGAADREIEKAIAALRQTTHTSEANAPESGPDDDIEAAVQKMRAQDKPVSATPDNGPAAGRASSGAAQFCPQCGNPRDANDKFCAFCGNHFD